MKKSIIITLVVIVAVLVGGYFLLIGKTQTPTQQNSIPQNNTTDNSSINESANQDAIVKSYEVVYTDSGYAPAELTIHSGDTVTFKNESSKDLWTASGVHPIHSVYSGTSLQQHCPDATNASFDECKNLQPGQSWSFTFTKSGAWAYHNHRNASDFGKIIVQ